MKSLFTLLFSFLFVCNVFSNDRAAFFAVSDAYEDGSAVVYTKNTNFGSTIFDEGVMLHFEFDFCKNLQGGKS